MKQVKYLSFDEMAQLRAKVEFEEHLSIYRGQGDFDSLINRKRIISSKVKWDDRVNLKLPAKNASTGDRGKDDDHNCLTFFRAFEKLTPQQAYDERLWVYLTHHQHFLEYMRRRWVQSSGPDDTVIKSCKAHFFCPGAARGRTRNNGLSRLWWLGYCAERAAQQIGVKAINPKRILKLLFFKQDVRASLVERPGTSMNVNVFNTIIRLLHEDFQTSDRLIFERDVFRELMIRLNYRGGVVLLDALKPPEGVRMCRKLIKDLI
jgi:hypothetical protein